MIRTVMVREGYWEVARACAMAAEMESYGYGLFNVKQPLSKEKIHVNQQWQQELFDQLYDLLYEANRSGCTFLYLVGKE